MSLQSLSTDSWTVIYKAQNDAEQYSEQTSDPNGTVARLEAAGYIIIEVIIDVF